MKRPLFFGVLSSPWGALLAGFKESGDLAQLGFVEDPAPPASEGPPQVARAAERLALQLEEYFAGGRRDFDIPLAPEGSDFQKKVWAELGRIPFGTTLSYRQQAERLGDPLAIRAVARANGQNPIAILIPCHRVIGSDGDLRGYAGGLHRKRALLELEGSLKGQAPLFAI